LYRSPNIVRVNTCRRLRLAGKVTEWKKVRMLSKF
jgi:hypothetical protein